MPNIHPPLIAHQWAKNKRHVIRITLTHYGEGNKPLIEIREYFLNSNGERQASKKGINLPILHIDDLLHGLDTAKAAIDDGWI